MKKIITGALIASVLLVTPSFANTDTSLNIMPISEGFQDEIMIDNSDIIIRNNILESDYKYNNSTFFTSKINTKNIVIPEDIKNEAKDIYFLVEEGKSRIFYGAALKNANTLEDAVEIKKEYNYKTVKFEEGKTEYIFNNKDLVENFGDDEYKNVAVTLVAKLEDSKVVALSNSAYVSINTKRSVLANLYNNQKDNDLYFGYYNRSQLESYLEELSEGKTRSEYKKMLDKADNKIRLAYKQNKTNFENKLNKIKRETHFKNYVNDFKIYTETEQLLSNLGDAVNNQLQNIRAYDAIDKIFK